MHYVEDPLILLLTHLTYQRAGMAFREQRKYASQIQLRELSLHTARCLSIQLLDHHLLRTAVPLLNSVKGTYI
jgi:hypothetical protein